MFTNKTSELFTKKNPTSTPIFQKVTPSFQKVDPNSGLIFPFPNNSQSHNQNFLFMKKQQKKGFKFNQKPAQSNMIFTIGSNINKPNNHDQNKDAFNGIFKNQSNSKNNLFQNRNLSYTPNTNPFVNQANTNTMINQSKTNPFASQPKTQNVLNFNNSVNPTLTKNQNKEVQNKGQGITNLFQNMNLNSPNSLPDNISKQLKYSIMSTIQKLQYEKNSLRTQNQFLTKRVQNLQSRNKELIDIINNLVGQKSVNNPNNLNSLNLATNTNNLNNKTNNINNQINNNFRNQNLNSLNVNNPDNQNKSNQFANQIQQLTNPMDQLSNNRNQQNKSIQVNNNVQNLKLNLNPSTVTVNLFKQDNIEPMGFTQKIFITDDGYGIKALITFNAFYSIKFIIIQQIQNHNGCFIFNTNEVLQNSLKTTLAQIQNKGYWFLFNPNSTSNVVSYDILQQIQPKILQALKQGNKEWIKLHLNMQKWFSLTNNPSQRVCVAHPEWQSSNCQIILYNYLNFNNSNNDARQVIKYQIQEWIKQTQKKNKQNDKNGVMYFDQNSGKLHMILTD